MDDCNCHNYCPYANRCYEAGEPYQYPEECPTAKDIDENEARNAYE